MAFTCKVVDLGKRWQCTSDDGSKTWFAGPDYKYQGKLASYQQTEVEPPKPTPILQPLPYEPKAGSKVYEDFKHWGRHETNYRSGGSGPSERWNSAAPYVNIMAVFDIAITEAKSMDNAGVKFRGGSHDDSNGGWYLAGIEFDDGAGIFGKEYPHPTTKHYESHVPAGKIGKIVGKKIQFCGVCYNDEKGVPTVESYAKAELEHPEWVFLGRIKDTGQLKPGPVLDSIGKKGSKTQQVQIRIDEAPFANVYRARVYEIEPPTGKN